MAYLVKADELLCFDAFARQWGIDPTEALARVALSSEKLAAPEAFVRFVQMSRLFEQAALHSGNPLFGVALACASGTYSLEGPVTGMLRLCPTLGEALRYGLRHNYAYGSSVSYATQPVPGQAAIELSLAARSRDAPHRQAVEFILTRTVVFARWISEGQFSPQAVLVTSRDEALRRGYEEAFRCPVVMGAPVAALRIAHTTLGMPLPHANPVLFRMCLSYVEANFGRQAGPVGDRVRLLMRQWLDAGGATLENVAAGLALHPKALQRQLGQEGVSFDQLLDEVRRARFDEIVTSGERLSVLRMAEALGYAEQTALTRACKRWFGLSPREYIKARH